MGRAEFLGSALFTNERGMDLKQIAMFAWLPFLAADLGSVASGYLTRIYAKIFGTSRVNSIVASSVTGAFLMISLALVAITKDPYITIALISVGGFGHQVISCMLSALVVESFDKGQMATVNGMRGSFAWIASFLFSLLIGVTADKIGFKAESYHFSVDLRFHTADIRDDTVWRDHIL